MAADRVQRHHREKHHSPRPQPGQIERVLPPQRHDAIAQDRQPPVPLRRKIPRVQPRLDLEMFR